MFDDDNGARADYVVDQVIGFLESDEMVPSGYTNFIPLYEVFAENLVGVPNPTMIIQSDGIPEIVAGTTPEEDLENACNAAKTFRQNNQDVQFLCFQSGNDIYDGATPFYGECGCDIVWLIDDEFEEENIQEKALSIALEMRNHICTPTQPQENPCDPINDLPLSLQAIEVACLAVLRNNRGEDPLLSSNELHPIVSQHCNFIDGVCKVKPEHQPLYPTNAPTPFPTNSPSTSYPTTSYPTSVGVADSQAPTTSAPTRGPTNFPTFVFSTDAPTNFPTESPTTPYPTASPTTSFPTPKKEI